MAKKRAGKSAKRTARAQRDEINPKQLVKDIQSVLRANGITAKVAEMSFSSAQGSSCTCPDGRTGVLRVVGAKLICVCPN